MKFFADFTGDHFYKVKKIAGNKKTIKDQRVDSFSTFAGQLHASLRLGGAGAAIGIGAGDGMGNIGLH